MKSLKQLHADLTAICELALGAINPAEALRSCVRINGNLLMADHNPFDLDKVRRIWVLGAGKAAAPMAQALEKILGDRLSGGAVVTRYGYGLPLDRIRLMESGHPFPDANSVAAGEHIIELAQSRIRPRDLVICLLSGGGSALLAATAPGITLEDKLLCTRVLLNCGAGIREINAVRKHLSALKGGGLARLLARVPVVSLILSDVVGDELDAIASGPLVPDSTSFGDCAEILRRYHIEELVPPAVRRRIDAGVEGAIPENPKPGDPMFRRKIHLVIGSNAVACGAAARGARRRGYHTLILTSQMEGDTAEAARFHLSIAKEIVRYGRPLRRPACVISGGETTVRVTGAGKGGRNQEFALHCVRELAHLPAPCVAASLATDGADGPTEAAGARVDNSTLARSLRFGASFLTDCLEQNDSHEFFRRLDDLIITGPTRTNVMDLHFFLIA